MLTEKDALQPQIHSPGIHILDRMLAIRPVGMEVKISLWHTVLTNRFKIIEVVAH
jgi:hypothetical protein